MEILLFSCLFKKIEAQRSYIIWSQIRRQSHVLNLINLTSQPNFIVIYENIAKLSASFPVFSFCGDMESIFFSLKAKVTF